MKQLLAAVLVSLSFLACKKNDKNVAEVPNYFPSTVGSNWKYQPSQGAAYTITATSRDTMALGISYKVYISTDGQNRYRTRVANEYFQFLAIPQILPNGVNELYLKDNQPVGATWSLSQMVTVPNIPFPVSISLAYSIKTKDTSMTVNNKPYTKVIKVGQDISVQGFGNIGSGSFFYADKVGLIKSEVNIAIPGQPATNASETLLSFEIK
jgi:hypothetical protein